MNNLEIYDKYRSVPAEAQRKIEAGRLKGMTDINPMWRIKALTEQFGMCGVGWYYDIERQWLEQGANDEITAYTNIKLYVKIGGEWSKGIVGTGGSKLVSKEKAGLYTDDECYKKALTDAISVACKALGFGADVYWSSDRTKYSRKTDEIPAVQIKKTTCDELLAEIHRTGTDINKVCDGYKIKQLSELSEEQAQKALTALKKRPTQNAGGV